MRNYQVALKYIIENGEEHDDRTGVGTRSVFGYQMRFPLREGFPLLTTKRVPFRWVAEELFWFLSGSTDERALNERGVDIWKEWATEEQCQKFARETGDLGPVYGFLWRHFGGEYISKELLATTQLTKNMQRGCDQISKLLKQLETQPNSRRLIVTGWDPERCEQVALPPCHTLFQFKVHRDSSLSCHLYARSIDAFLGLPFNIASYALLTHLIAFVTNREVRDLIISFGDLHIYKSHFEAVREQLSREPLPLPSLKITSDWPRSSESLAHLLHLRYEHLQIEGYSHHPKISAPVAV